jgi:6-phosphofructokinase 2
MTDILTVTMSPAIDVSVLTERIAPVRKTRCRDVRRNPGGGGVNVARVITRLGGRCRALYPAGGSAGSLLTELLDREGVESLRIDIAETTRENFTVNETATGDQYRFVLPGTPLAPNEWRDCLDRIAALLTPSGFLVASGSLPEGPPEDFFAKLSALAADKGARMVLDTSGPPLRQALEAGGLDLVKPNLRELCEYVGRKLTHEAEWTAAIRGIVASGKAKTVVLTLAERGALMAEAEDVVRAPGLAVPVESAVGAGDSFLGAMVWRLTEGDHAKEAFRYGMAAGTAAIATPGTELCGKHDVERFYADIHLDG